MFSVIYRFEIYAHKEEEFIKAWEEMTQLIMKYEGGLGSRLHKENDTTYIAYAQWPDKQTWKNSGNKLPEEANRVRQQMREVCENIKTIHELEVIKDLLK